MSADDEYILSDADIAAAFRALGLRESSEEPETLNSVLGLEGPSGEPDVHLIDSTTGLPVTNDVSSDGGNVKTSAEADLDILSGLMGWDKEGPIF